VVSERQRRGLQAAASGCLLAMSASGLASEPARYELDYSAEAACPSLAAFEQLVQAQLAEFGDASRTIQARAIVRFRSSPAGAVGRFDLERQDGSRSSRQLESTSCEEAATALAFVLALALGGREAAPAGSASQPPLEAQLAPEPPAPTADRPRTAADVAPVRASWHWRFGVGVQLGARSGVGPSVTPVGGGVIALRIAFLRAQPITYSDDAGTSSFKWLAGRVEGCLWSARFFAALSASPCLTSQVGRLTVTGEPEALPGAAGGSAAKLWLEAGGALRLELRVVKSLSIEAQGEALVPFTRYRFAFDRPDTLVYQVPPLAAGAFLGLAAHFP